MISDIINLTSIFHQKDNWVERLLERLKYKSFLLVPDSHLLHIFSLNFVKMMYYYVFTAKQIFSWILLP